MLGRNANSMRRFRSEVNTHIMLLTQISDSIAEKLQEIVIKPNRNKRGLIDGVGSIFKSITGNLDASDGKYFTDSINKLNNNQHQIENLLKNQMSVTISVIKGFNETIQNLHVNEENLNKNLIEISKMVYEVKDEVGFIDAKMNFFEICEELLESYMYIQDHVNDILNSITFARLRIIHSSIITPDSLFASLQEISQNLVKSNLPLPIKHSQIAQYLNIIELEAFQTNSEVVFILKIPLTEQQSFNVYHLYPIPILDNRTGLFHVLSFTQKFIARNDDSLMYVPIKTLEECKQLGQRMKLCSNLYAYPIDDSAPCEVQLFKNLEEVPKNCRSVLILGQGYNVQKLTDNTWLVITSESIHTTISCINQATKLKVFNKNFVIKLQLSCYAFVGKTKLQPQTLNVLNIEEKSHPVLIPYNCCNDIPEVIGTTKLKPLKLNSLNIDNLEVASHKLEEYSRDLDKLINEPFVTKNISWFTYLIIASIIGIVLSYPILKIVRQILKRNKVTKDLSIEMVRPEGLKGVQSLPKFRPRLSRTIDEEEEERSPV